MTATAPEESTQLLEGQNRILELIVQGEALPRILDSLLGVIQTQCPGMLCSILLLDSDGVHVRHGAARDLPETYLHAVDGLQIGPQAGSCGTAAFRHEAVIVEDIAADPLWDSYRELALQHDLHACWSTPIFDQQRRVLGTFAIYMRAPGRPEARHLRLIEISTHIAAIAITKHKEVEALRASEDRLRLALSGFNVGIWEYNVEAGSLAWRGPIHAILGRSNDGANLTLQSFVDAIYPEDRPNVQAAFRDLSGPGFGREVDFRVMHPDGSLHWFMAKGRPEYDSAGKAVLIRGVALEITEQKRTQQEIQRREAQLAEAQSIACLGSYEWDLRANIVHRSAELYRIFGLSADEFEPTYEGYLARVHPEDRGNTKGIIDRAFAEGLPFDFEERIVRPDGSIRMLHSRGQWSFDDHHQPIKLLGICQDITERKCAEQQLRDANAALAAELAERTRAGQEIHALTARLIDAQEEERTRIARELHDDLSQQIATLSIAASNLKREISPDDTEARAQSERIQQKLFHLAEGVRRLSHHLHPAVLEYSGLGAALAGYCAEFSTLTGIAVAFQSDGSFEDLPAPVSLCLYRIAQEALQNVLKHARVREASVAITRSAQSVFLTVSDQGAGIDTLKSMPQGLGLLNIRERTRLVNGTVTIESRPNQGTTLRVTVPVEP